MTKLELDFTKEEFAEVGQELVAISNGTSKSNAVVFGDPNSGDSVTFTLVENLSSEELQSRENIEALEAKLTKEEITRVELLAAVLQVPYSFLLNRVVEQKEANPGTTDIESLKFDEEPND